MVSLDGDPIVEAQLEVEQPPASLVLEHQSVSRLDSSGHQAKG